MAVPFYAKSETNQGYIKNMEVLGFCDLNGINAFQMALYKTGDRYLMYCGSFKGAEVNIVDVTDPTKPTVVGCVYVSDPKIYFAQSTPKVQVANDPLIVALGGGVPFLHGIKPGDPADDGLQIYSLKEDPIHPKLLSHWHTGLPNGMGVHRFAYNGGRYVYMPAECPGFIGFIVRILDIADPCHPVEAGRWWLPKQFKDGMVEGTYAVGHDAEKFWGMCHACNICADRPNELYLGYFGGGAIILDISDPTRPKLISQLMVQPPFAGKFDGAQCHTYMRLTGRNFAVLTNEGERFPFFNRDKILNGVHKGAQPMNNLHMIDVSDPADPTLVAEFPYPEVPEGYTHGTNFNDIHEPMGKPWLEDNPNRIYNCYFHAGLRVFDVSDPYYIKELAYFIPPNPEKLLFPIPIPGPMIATTEDCVVDDRGYIYIDTWHDGMYILRCLV